jgi:hypothetical protein
LAYRQMREACFSQPPRPALCAFALA